MREWMRKNPDKAKVNHRNTYLKYKDSVSFREKRKAYRESSKVQKAATDKEYREANKEKIALNKRSYYLKNREHLIKANVARAVERRKTDTIYNLKSVLRTQIIVNLVKRKYKKSLKTEELLGAKIEVVKAHLESLFAPDMTWENHGTHGWHIDHKIPLASAKNKEDVYVLFHYKNLQPLWAIENLRKGAVA